MIDPKILAQMQGHYECPPDAGPAWRAAMEMGMDMSLLEHNLRLTPWERLLQNESALALVEALQSARPASDAESD